MDANSLGMQERVGVETLGSRVLCWASCHPGTGTLSPSVGLWYPRGKMKHHLMLKEGCDSIHMCVDVVVSSCLLFTHIVLYTS